MKDGSWKTTGLAAAVCIAAIVAAYQGSFTGPFLFDDLPSIVRNRTIRQLWPPFGAFSPPHGLGLTVEGRPVLNASFAVNYALGGFAPWTYHALNLAIHVLADLTLFGIVRRTLASRGGGGRAGGVWPACAVALLWGLHPLQTESVTYIAQRAESLMGLFYLLTLYGFIRSVGMPGKFATEGDPAPKATAATPESAPAPRRGWQALSWFACLLGMATKEVMVSAPLIIWLYDGIFVAGGFADALRKRRGYYLALASTWLLLAWLVAGSGSRGGAFGAGSGVPWWLYGLAQFHGMAHYLWLAVWPHRLVFDYGNLWPKSAGDVAPYAVLVIGLAAAAVLSLRRRAAFGFLGAWFFCILAPTSSILPGNRQTWAEHRMYLPLAAVAVLVVCAARRLLGRRFWVPLAVIAAAFGVATTARNRAYQSDLALCADTAAKVPGNPFAQSNYGNALAEAGRQVEAVDHFQEALRLLPEYPDARFNLANSYAALGRLDEAIAQYRDALRLDPGNSGASYNLGVALLRAGRTEEAASQLAATLRIDPGHEKARSTLALVDYNLGIGLADAHRLGDAVDHYQRALALKPDFAEAHLNVANALAQLGRLAEAIPHYQEALRINPQLSQAKIGLDLAARRLSH